MHEKIIKLEFLLLYRYCINSQNFFFGRGEVGGFGGGGGGGEASPLHPPVDETLALSVTTCDTRVPLLMKQCA